MNRLDVETGQDRRVDRTRCFSAQRANSALVLVRMIVADIVAGYARLMELQEMLESQGGSDGPRHELIALVERLQTYLEELDCLGVELKDWALGVVDFPSVSDGRPISLCWQHGEPSVGFWHEADQGFDSRQPLSTLMMEQVAGASR